MEEESRALRVADLLVESGLLTAELLENRLEIAKQLGQPLGQTLIQTGDVTRYQLLCVIQLQSLCLDGALPADSAVEAMKLIAHEEYFLEDALAAVGCANDSMWTAKLGELLLHAGAISEQELKTALDIAFHDCSPLGQVLLRTGLARPSLIAKALGVQKRIRQRELTKAQAIDELKEFYAQEVPAVEK